MARIERKTTHKSSQFVINPNTSTTGVTIDEAIAKDYSAKTIELAKKLKADNQSTIDVSDQYYLDYARRLLLKNLQMRGKFAKQSMLSEDGITDQKWAGYTYEEIIDMDTDGYVIPDEVLEWAYSQQQSDVTSYVIVSDEENSNDKSSTESVEDDSNIKNLQNKVTQYVTKSEKAIEETEKLVEEFNTQKQQAADFEKNQKDAYKKETEEIDKLSTELKKLEDKNKSGTLTQYEQEQYKDLTNRLNNPTPSKNSFNTTDLELENFLDSIQEFSTIIEENNQLSEDTTKTAKDLSLMAKTLPESMRTHTTKDRYNGNGLLSQTLYNTPSGDISLTTIETARLLNDYSALMENEIFSNQNMELQQFAADKTSPLTIAENNAKSAPINTDFTLQKDNEKDSEQNEQITLDENNKNYTENTEKIQKQNSQANLSKLVRENTSSNNSEKDTETKTTSTEQAAAPIKNANLQEEQTVKNENTETTQEVEKTSATEETTDTDETTDTKKISDTEEAKQTDGDKKADSEQNPKETTDENSNSKLELVLGFGYKKAIQAAANSTTNATSLRLAKESMNQIDNSVTKEAKQAKTLTKNAENEAKKAQKEHDKTTAETETTVSKTEQLNSEIENTIQEGEIEQADTLQNQLTETTEKSKTLTQEEDSKSKQADKVINKNLTTLNKYTKNSNILKQNAASIASQINNTLLTSTNAVVVGVGTTVKGVNEIIDGTTLITTGTGMLPNPTTHAQGVGMIIKGTKLTITGFMDSAAGIDAGITGAKGIAEAATGENAKSDADATVKTTSKQYKQYDKNLDGLKETNNKNIAETEKQSSNLENNTEPQQIAAENNNVEENNNDEDISKDEAVSSASASVNATINDVLTDDKADRKLARFNNDSIIESKKKNKKVVAVSASAKG